MCRGRGDVSAGWVEPSHVVTMSADIVLAIQTTLQHICKPWDAFRHDCRQATARC